MRHHNVSTDTPAYVEVAPPRELAGYIDACWFFEPCLDEPKHDILIPEGVVDLIFNFGAPYYRQCASDDDKDGEWIANDVAIGQRTRLFSVEWPIDTRLFAVRLKTEAAHLFFAIPMHEITNCTKPLQDTDFRELSEAIHQLSYPDQDGITSHCFSFFADRVERLDSPDARVSDVILEIETQEGNMDIQHLCNKLGFNRRTIERLFANRVGISPKFLARTVRLHHFLCLQSAQSDADLSHAAMDAQYYDQSHLIKDFKQFTGESPARFFNSPPEIYEPLLVSLLGRRRSAADGDGS
jgi:AraC-like DNA-binding protein